MPAPDTPADRLPRAVRRRRRDRLDDAGGCAKGTFRRLRRHRMPDRDRVWPRQSWPAAPISLPLWPLAGFGGLVLVLDPIAALFLAVTALVFLIGVVFAASDGRRQPRSARFAGLYQLLFGGDRPAGGRRRHRLVHDRLGADVAPDLRARDLGGRPAFRAGRLRHARDERGGHDRRACSGCCCSRALRAGSTSEPCAGCRSRRRAPMGGLPAHLLRLRGQGRPRAGQPVAAGRLCRRAARLHAGARRCDHQSRDLRDPQGQRRSAAAGLARARPGRPGDRQPHGSGRHPVRDHPDRSSANARPQLDREHGDRDRGPRRRAGVRRRGTPA